MLRQQSYNSDWDPGIEITLNINVNNENLLRCSGKCVHETNND